MSFETKEDVLLRILTQERPSCTYCGKKMSIWEVPQFPFEDGLGWGTPYLFVCFNNQCPMYEQGWNHIRQNYGRYASYRCICYPGNKTYACMAIFGPKGATGQIIDDEIAAAKLQALKTGIERKLSDLEDCYASKDWQAVLKILLDPNEQDIVRIKAAKLIGEIGKPEAIEPIKNKKDGNGFLSRIIEKSIEKIHERYFTRECPFCAEIIKKDIRICEHCGKILFPKSKISSEQKIYDQQN
jgi:hypothetical protein